MSSYWNSMDFDSEGTLSTKNSSSPKNYIDPWDLENYDYIRKRIDPEITSTSVGEVLDSSFYYTLFDSKDNFPESSNTKKSSGEYAKRGEIDFRNEIFESVSPIYYHQPYYEEDIYGIPPDYSDMEENVDRYSPLITDGSLLYMYETANRYRKMAMPRSPAPQSIYGEKVYPSHYDDDYYSTKYPIYAPVDNTYYGVRNSTIPIYDDINSYRKPQNFGLSNYGHLKIDYSCSWNSLDRIIGK